MRSRPSKTRRRPSLQLQHLEARDVPATLQIISLDTTNSSIVDHDSLTGDDRGGIAVTNNRVLVTGDNRTAGFDLDLSNASSTGFVYDGIFSDLRTGDLYTLATSPTSPVFNANTNTITDLLKIDDLTGALTGEDIPLSSPVTLSNGFNAVGIFSGAGRVVLYDSITNAATAVDTTSGLVTPLGTLPPGAFNPNGSENWAIWGVAEGFGGDDYLTYREINTSDIVRTRVSDGVTSVVGTFTNLSDMASFTVSPATNRWYFHYEGSGEFGGSSETLGYADATIDLTTIADFDPVTPGQRTQAVNSVDITFTAPITPATFNFQDIILRRNGGGNLITSAVTVTDQGNNKFRIGNLGALTAAEGRYVLSVVGAGINDAGSTPLPEAEHTSWIINSRLGTPVAASPAGSLVYTIPTETRGLTSATDIQSLKLDLTAGQSISLIVTPDPALRSSVTLTGPTGAVIGTDSASVAGEPLILNGQGLTASGTYTLAITPLGGTVGNFELDVTLNASLESEEIGGADNGTTGTAQPLTFRTLAPGVSVAAVNGRVNLPLQGTATQSNISVYTGPQTSSLMGIAAVPAAGGVLRISTLIDNAYPYQTVDVDVEGVVLTTLPSNPNGFTSPRAVYDIPLSDADLATLLADTQLDVTLNPNNIYNPGTATFELFFATATDVMDDYYSMTLAAGDHVSVATDAKGINVDGQVEILDSNSVVQDSSFAAGSNVGQAIPDFVAPAAGTYFVHVLPFTAPGSYNLVVTRGAAFDLEPNTLVVPQFLVAPKAILGSTNSGGDSYAIDLAAGTRFSWGTSNPGITGSTLDAALELYDSTGALVASNDNGGADGKNAVLTYKVLADDTYTLKVFGVANTSGEYLLRELPASATGGGGRIVVAPDKGGQPIQVFADGKVVLTIPQPFGATYTGVGIRVAQGDVNGDGVADIIAATGPKAIGTVRVFDGVTGAQIGADLLPVKKSKAGLYVAAGDVNGDGKADIFVGSVSGPKVQVFNGADHSLLNTITVKGYAGVVVAAGDVDGDGKAELIAGKRSGSHVRIITVSTGAIIREFDAFDKTQKRGVFVAAGDVDGDGKADVIVGTGAGKGSAGLVSVFKGTDASPLFSTSIFGVGFNGGIRVAAGDVNGDGFADIIVGAGALAAKVSVINGKTKEKLPDLTAFDPITDPVGVFVG